MLTTTIREQKRAVMGWLDDKERIIELQREVDRLRSELKVAIRLCEDQISKAAVLGYPLEGAYVDHWRQAKARFEQALAGDA